MRLLVTRPEPDGERTAAALRARGHEVTLAPLLRIEPVAFDLPQQSFAAVVLTSANAARALAGHPARAALTALPALVVGGRSAEAYLDCTARARMRVRALVPVHFCLSVQVSHPLLAVGAPKIRIAPRPDEAALLELVGEG